MPYIKKELREGLDFILLPLLTVVRKTPNHGALNYIFTRILLSTEPENYEDYNALVGVLECAKLELYRRAVAPYENKKKKREGDVF